MRPVATNEQVKTRLILDERDRPNGRVLLCQNCGGALSILLNPIYVDLWGPYCSDACAPVTCPTCNGDGLSGAYYQDGSPYPCPDCKGDGLALKAAPPGACEHDASQPHDEFCKPRPRGSGSGSHGR